MNAFSVIITAFICMQNGEVFGLTGGEPAKEGEFPFMVSIKDNRNCHVCGGIIIGDRWVLTGNPCYSRAWWGSISFGSTKLTLPINYTCNSYNSSIQRHVDDVLYNPHAWDRPPYTHDMVLVHLNESIPFGENVQPVQLAEVDEPWPSDKSGTILGWGNDTSSSGLIGIQTDLQKAQVPLYSEEYCANSSIWGGWELADPTVMRCGGEVNKTYYCYNDYGGPLLVDGIQYGVISYARTDPGGPCGTYLGIFSPVSYFRQWIKDTTGI